MAAKQDFVLHVGREMNRSWRRRSSRTGWSAMSCVLFMLCCMPAATSDVAHTWGPRHRDRSTETTVLTKMIKLSGLTNGFVFVFVLHSTPPKVPPSFPHGLSIAEDLACLHQESIKALKRLFIAFYSGPPTFSFNATALALF